MRVMGPPYDLLVLTACQDILALCCGLLRRAEKGGCVAPFRFFAQRDAKGRHDAFWRQLDLIIPPTLSSQTRVLLLWDHHGSGREQLSCAEAEAEALGLLDRRGIGGERALAVALEPEVEVLLVDVWSLVKEKLAGYARRPLPEDEQVLQRARRLPRSPIVAGMDFGEALRRHPKECLEGLRQLLQLGTLATVHQVLGEQLSLPRLKGAGAGELDEAALRGRPAARIARQLSAWFPGAATCPP